MNNRLDIELLEDITEKLKAIAHPLRFLIVDILYKDKALSVTEIHEKLNIEQAVASHHLRILKNQGIVKFYKDGKNSLYSLTKEEYHDIIKCLLPSE